MTPSPVKKEISPKQQAIDLIKKGSRFLVITHARPDADAIAASLSVKMVLEKIGKKVDVVIPDHVSSLFSFFPGVNNVIKNISLSKDLIVNIKGGESGFFKISYNKKEDGSIDLVVSPRDKEIKEQDVSLVFNRFDYDGVFMLDTPDFGRTSETYLQNKDAISSIPIINIDHHNTNGNFGAINIVDTTATSTCEILFSLFEALDKELLDSDIATLLLSGIISDTDRFQNTNTSPKSMTVSAQLIALGAKRTEIVRSLFKTKPVSTLRLWGKILSNIREDRDDRIVWSTISAQEIAEVGAHETETEGVINDLISTAPNANLVMLLAERRPGFVTASLRTNSELVDVDRVALAFGGGGHRKAAGFRIENTNLREAEKEVVKRIKGYLKNELKIKELEKEAGVVFEAPESQDPVVFEKKEPKPERILEPKPNLNEDDLYAPSLSDIILDKPKILDDEDSSILKRVLQSKKPSSEKLDFAEMERNIGRGKAQEEDDLDEDYE